LSLSIKVVFHNAAVGAHVDFCLSTLAAMGRVPLDSHVAADAGQCKGALLAMCLALILRNGGWLPKRKW